MLIVLLLAVSSAAQSCLHKNITAVATRPTFSNSTETVQCGVVQMEYGYARQWQAGGAALSSGLAFGVAPNLDIRWTSDNVLFSGSELQSPGVGDSWIGARYRVNEQRRLLPSLGILYSFKIPIASQKDGLGSGYIDHSIALFASKDIGQVHADFNVVRVAYGSSVGRRYSDFAGLAVSRHICKRLSGTVEGYGGGDLVKTASLLAGTSWRWSDRLQTDVAMERRIWGNGGTRLTFGMTFAMANLYRSFRW